MITTLVLSALLACPLKERETTWGADKKNIAWTQVVCRSGPLLQFRIYFKEKL